MTTIQTTPASYDFDDLMQSLKVFMQSQTEFKDYNFEGSGIRELMRLLAYDAQQRALQNQFAFSELNLDSAQLRQNVVTHAANLGYFSRGNTAASVPADIVVTPKDNPDEGTQLILRKDVRFFANRDGGAVFFSPDKEYVTTLVDGVYTFSNVRLVQGTWNFTSFLSSADDAVEAFVISDRNIDVDTMLVQVRENETTSAYTIFNKFKTAYDLGSTQTTYFVKENRDGLFEIEFGDGKVARKLSFGNVIIVEYLSTLGAVGNGIGILTPANGIGNYFDIQVDLKGEKSFGGSDFEDINTIKKAAPTSYAAQGNAVTAGDYAAIVKEIMPSAKSIIAWGGENNKPLKIGYTFVSVVLENGGVLSGPQKTSLKNDLEKYNVGPIDVIVVDPEYVYLVVDTTIGYNPRETALAEVPFTSKVTDFIKRFSKSKLEAFDAYFNKSKLIEFINRIDRSIKGNKTTVQYEKRFLPAINFVGTYSFDFDRSLMSGTLLIENFIVTDTDSTNFVYFINDVNGILKLQKRNTETDNVVFIKDIGQIDYENGRVDIVGFTPITILNGYVRLRVRPQGDESLQVFGKDIPTIETVNVKLEAAYA